VFSGDTGSVASFDGVEVGMNSGGSGVQMLSIVICTEKSDFSHSIDIINE